MKGLVYADCDLLLLALRVEVDGHLLQWDVSSLLGKALVLQFLMYDTCCGFCLFLH